jgi:uncharacterized damage-inducible protein DinB
MEIYKSLIDRLENQHLTIFEVIEKLPSKRKTIRPAVDKWNIHDNIAHLTKYQLVFIDRLEIILKGHSPHFERYKAENDPDFEMFRKMNESDLLKSLNQDRRALIGLISNLAEGDLVKIGVHRKFGELNIVQWLEFFVLHEAHHIYTIFQLANDIDLEAKNDK